MSAPESDPDAVRERTRAYYDTVAETYLALFRDELGPKEYDRAALERFAARVGARGRVIDAGCGPCGHVARYLTDAGLEVTGVDLSPVCVALARREQPDLRFETMAMEAMTFPDASFDGLVAYHSLMYLPKAVWPALARGFHRVLRPGGVLLVVAKEGEGEGLVPDPLGSGLETFFALAGQTGLERWLTAGGFRVLHADTREPYPFEIPVRRVFVLAER